MPDVVEKVASVEPDKVITEKQIDANNVVRNAYPPDSEVIPDAVVQQVETKAAQTSEDILKDKFETEVAEVDTTKANSAEFISARKGDEIKKDVVVEPKKENPLEVNPNQPQLKEKENDPLADFGIGR